MWPDPGALPPKPGRVWTLPELSPAQTLVIASGTCVTALRSGGIMARYATAENPSRLEPDAPPEPGLFPE